MLFNPVLLLQSLGFIVVLMKKQQKIIKKANFNLAATAAA